MSETVLYATIPPYSIGQYTQPADTIRDTGVFSWAEQAGAVGQMNQHTATGILCVALLSYAVSLTRFLSGSVYNLRMDEQRPCKTLTAATAISHILPIQKIVTARTDSIAVPTLKQYAFRYRQPNAVGKSIKNGGLTKPLL